ncbi:DUF1850 domain-containing protein [Yoonia sp.]|uniref:DUF1850 domain-containing protein n=1 Tax=Yoonia sp. TaxID=2212373 RepID=UPI00391A8836
MIKTLTGRSFWVALLVCTGLWPAQVLAQTLQIRQNDTAASLGQLPFAPGQEICLHWQHSVTGGDVADCFENRAGRMTLTRSYLHDFAAGLGDIAGRGTIQPAAHGGYWITGMADTIPGNSLALRVGDRAVNHRLKMGDLILRLSQIAPRTLVHLRLQAD